VTKTVSIKVLGGAPSLIAEMAAMRDWLNQHRCEPSRFDCRKSGDCFSIDVGFDQPEEAAAFEKRFGRSRLQSNPVMVSELKDLPGKPHPGTMAQVRYWRLIAKKIRAKADELASRSQKPWPGLVEIALTYERMAENLERRLAKR
jgi:hypothetical protein